MTFGERLTGLRIENGYYKRKEFAEKLGIPSTTLRNYETDAREPGHTFLKQVSKLFHVTVDYLLCLTDEREVMDTFRLKTSEYEHLKKYRALDGIGRRHIDTVLAWETERISHQAIRIENEEKDLSCACKETYPDIPDSEDIKLVGRLPGKAEEA